MSAAPPMPPSDDELPTPVVKNRRWIPRLVWVVPIAAAVIGISLLIKNWENQGPQITISFLSGEGVQVGKTLVKYRDVTVGHVSAVGLSADHKTVLVSADLSKDAASLLKADTQFWIVRPRIGVGSVSGLGTLLSGVYIGLKAGTATLSESHFMGLENPPALSHGPHGRELQLQAARAGSLSVGAPVYFRQFQVGRVIDENLLPDGSTRVSVFVEAPYDGFVKSVTRFWNASGIDVRLGADGLSVQTESLAAVLAGGVAFDDGPAETVAAPTGLLDEYTLYKNETEAMAPPDGDPRYVRMRFSQALRGLDVGAPVEFVGVNIGSVVAVDLGYERQDKSFPVIVTAKVYPRRMGQAYSVLAAQGHTESEETLAAFVGTMVNRGLRAQPRSASLLTGKLYIALDFLPASPRAAFDASNRPLELPTVNGTFQELEAGVARIVKKVNDLPLEQIAADLHTDLNDLHETLSELHAQVLPSAVDTLSALHRTLDSASHTLDVESPLQRGLAETLLESRSTLQAVRELADYLDRHPDALLRGRRPQKLPQGPAAALSTEVKP
ncbi:MAG: paraquat-inducible protein [Gammaproteobacteria bacterium]|jgi:paraquat-inducible protein B|nr:paraquat-inducible protein [Gammaproteobacteria bacterium]